MYRIIDKRSSGKTGRLLLLAKEKNSTVVCSNPTAMRTKAHAYGITDLNFISYSDYFKETHEVNETFMIDELDEFLKQISIIGYTITNEDD